MKHIKIFLGIFVVLAASRFIPHPPNFTSLIALSFCVPAIFGTRFIPITLICFIFTDLIIGIHANILFTWGSIIFIGLISNHFKKNFKTRTLGVLTSCLIFYLITNFGVWSTGFYEFSLNGFIECYVMAIPFFGNTLMSTIIYFLTIEAIYKYILVKKNFLKI